MEPESKRRKQNQHHPLLLSFVFPLLAPFVCDNFLQWRCLQLLCTGISFPTPRHFVFRNILFAFPKPQVAWLSWIRHISYDGWDLETARHQNVIQCLLHFENLQTLSLCNLHCDLRHCLPFLCLTSLGLKHMWLDQHDWGAICNHQSLITLSLENCNGIGMISVFKLTQLLHLESLVIDGYRGVSNASGERDDFSTDRNLSKYPYDCNRTLKRFITRETPWGMISLGVFLSLLPTLECCALRIDHQVEWKWFTCMTQLHELVVPLPAVGDIQDLPTSLTCITILYGDKDLFREKLARPHVIVK